MVYLIVNPDYGRCESWRNKLLRKITGDNIVVTAISTHTIQTILRTTKPHKVYMAWEDLGICAVDAIFELAPNAKVVIFDKQFPKALLPEDAPTDQKVVPVICRADWPDKRARVLTAAAQARAVQVFRKTATA